MNDDDDNLIRTPRKNAGLLGHEAAEAALLDAYGSGRFHHAWLISGPKGIGKATLAFRFARYLLARNVPMPDRSAPGDAGLFGELPEDPGAVPPAPKLGEDGPLYVSPDHPVFSRVAAGGHADLFTVARSINTNTGRLRTEIVVDDVHGITSFLRLTAAEGGPRIVIIDAADEMNVTAANAVLKVLEEPPANAMLLLVCHNPGRLLPTIRSRCRKLMVDPLSEDTVKQLVRHYAPDVPPADAAMLAHLADGSIGRALSLHREGGIDLYRDLMTLLDTLPDLNHLALHSFGDRVARNRDGDAFLTVTDLLGWWLARFITFAAGGGGTPDEDERQLMTRLMVGGGLDRWLLVWEKINHLVGRTDAVNLDRKQVVLNAFLMLEKAARP